MPVSCRVLRVSWSEEGAWSEAPIRRWRLLHFHYVTPRCQQRHPPDVEDGTTEAADETDNAAMKANTTAPGQGDA